MGRWPTHPLPSKLTFRRVSRGLAFILIALIATLGGCKKKEGRIPARSIHAITNELVTAVIQAAPQGADIRSALRASDSQPDSADHLYVTLRADGNESARRTVLVRMLQALGAVATKRGLTQDEPVESSGLFRFNYRHAGVVTHTIHIVSPIAARKQEPAGAGLAGHARLAIILDDLGNDRAAADAIFSLPYPLTVSVLPDHPHSAEIAEEAHRRGYQVLLHLPMQSVANERPEPAELRPGLAEAEVSSIVAKMLESVPTVAGVNNHQGSQATADPTLMSELMPVLREHNLFYVDSRTTAATVAYDTAHQLGVRAAFRNVPFLDDVVDVSAIRKQLARAIRGAQTKGGAIAIGHPHPATLQALSEVLPQLEKQGVHLVFASELVQ